MENIKQYDSFMDMDEQEIRYLCNRYIRDYDGNIPYYYINDDKSINVNDSVILYDRLEDFEKLPFTFNVVSGRFNCDRNSLTTLEGCPKKVNYYFSCMFNKLTSLEYSPRIVEGNFWCSENHLITTLEGLENTYIEGKLYVNGCIKLYSLKGFPKRVDSFYCWDTPIQPIFDTFIQEPDPEAISRFNRLKVIDTDGLDWWVYYDQLGKFLRSVDKEHLAMSEKDFDDFIKTTLYRWDY